VRAIRALPSAYMVIVADIISFSGRG